MISEITSTSNQKYKFIKSLQKKKARTENGLFCVEGIKSVDDAFASDFDISCIAVQKSFYESGGAADYKTADTDIYVIADNIFGGLCDTQTPQGILAVIRIRKNTLTNDSGKAYIYCDHISDPGNLGTIIRTADAGGMDGILLSPGCVDLYSPKTVRSSMGSFFHIPVYEDITVQRLCELSENGYRILSSALTDNTTDYREADYTGSVVLALGNEANGISGELADISTQFVKIPILGRAESLNVSIAGAIFIYEFVRNRQK